MPIILKSSKLRVTNINRPTKAKMFTNLSVGDVILLSIPVRHAGSNKGTYASYIKIENVATGEYTHKSFNEITSMLRNFEFEEIE